MRTVISKIFSLVTLLLAIEIVSTTFIYAKKKPKATSSKNEKTSIQMKSIGDKPRTFFSSIDENIVNDVEVASPQSLQRALGSLRKSQIDYTDTEKILLATAQNLLKIVYPMDKYSADTIDAPTNNPYIGTFQSIQNGIFDTSTGNTDFLSTVLPAVVLLKKSDVTQIYDDCQKALDAAIKLKPNSVLAHYLLAMLYKKARMGDSSVFEFQTAKGLAPESVQIIYDYCSTLNELGRTKEANALVASLLEKDPTSFDALKLAANTAYSLGNYTLADEYIARVLQQEPNDLAALLFRAKVLFAKKDYIRVASMLDMYARQDSTNKDYLLLRCLLQYEWSHAVNSAISTLEEAIKLYAPDIDVCLMAARLANETGTKIAGMSADEYSSMVLDRDPNNITALQYSIDALIVKGDYKKAYSASKGVLATNGDKNTPAGLNNLLRHVKICLKNGKTNEAMEIIEPLYKEKGGDENVLETYITFLSDTGMKTAAFSLINQLLPSAQSRMKSFLYYRRSLLQADLTQGINDLRNALMSNPRNSDALFRLYKIYYNTKDYRKAQYYLKQVVALNPNNEEYQKLNMELNRILGQ